MKACFSALSYTTKFCCDRHSDGFNLQDFLPGKIYEPSPLVTKKRGKYPKYRATKDRPALDHQLMQWLEKEHEGDEYDILSHLQRVKLVRTQAKDLHNPGDITLLLGESREWEAEWAFKLFALLQQYEAELKLNKSNTNSQTSNSNSENIPPTSSRLKRVAKRAKK